MNKVLIILFSISSLYAHGQTVQVAEFEDLQRILLSGSDTTYVVNFWATWCVPCVKEFPAFQNLAANHQSEKVKVVMVSLDFASEKERTLLPFLRKHPIDAHVMLLDEPDYNAWIGRVDKAWGGEIPVTIIVNGARKIRRFFDHDFTPSSLEDTFTKTINNQQ